MRRSPNAWLLGGFVFFIVALIVIGWFASGSTLNLGAGMAAMGVVVPALIILAIAGGLYFLPTIIAVRRHKPNMDAIAALNLLLGWTLLGWVGALVWSLTAEVNPPARQ